MDPSSHPDLDDSAAQPGGSSLATKIVIGVALAVVALVVILHLTGVVGPRAH